MPARDIYAELAAMAGVDALIEKASDQLAQHKPVHALHFLEVALAQEPDNVAALRGQLAVYEMTLQDAIDISKNNYEKDYMRTLISQTKEKLAQREAN